jgi:hypothetical protein
VCASSQFQDLSGLSINTASEMQYQVISEARPDPEYSLGENQDRLPMDATSEMIIWSVTDERVGYTLEE